MRAVVPNLSSGQSHLYTACQNVLYYVSVEITQSEQPRPQGLSSPALGGGKNRDPGNEVAIGEVRQILV